MKKKLLFLGLTSLLLCSTGCNKNDLPIITKIDISNSSIIFCANTYSDGKNGEKALNALEAYGNSQLCEITKNDQVKRVRIDTKNKEDDSFFDNGCLFTLQDLDEKHFYMRSDTGYDYQGDGRHSREYLADKETGECVYVGENDFGFANPSYRKRTPSAKRSINKDEQGNYYGIDSIDVNNVSTQQLVKKSLDKDNCVKTEKISFEDNNYSILKNFAVDKFGNAAYAAFYWGPDKSAHVNYITANGKQINVDTKEKIMVTVDSASYGKYQTEYVTKGFWQGYDGEIYTNEEDYICKLVPRKDSNGEITSIEQVRVSEKMNMGTSDPFTYGESYFFFDDLQEIYLFDFGEDTRSYELYCIYGPRMGQKILSPLGDTFKEDRRRYQGGYHSSGDSIYFVWNHKATRVNIKNGFSCEEISFDEGSGNYLAMMSSDNKAYFADNYNFNHLYICDFNTTQPETKELTGCQFKHIGILDDGYIVL